MFWITFCIVFALCIILYLLMNGFAASRSSGPGTPINWILLISISAAIAAVVAFVIIGIVTIF